MPPLTAAFAVSEQVGAQLLDFTQKLDIALLDNVVACMYGGDPVQVAFTLHALNAFTCRYTSDSTAHPSSGCIPPVLFIAKIGATTA